MAGDEWSDNPAYDRGMDALEADDWTAAEAFLRTALDTQPERARVAANLGFALQQQGRLDEARAAMDRACAAAPTDAYTWFRRAQLALQTDDHDTLLAASTRCVEVDPEGPFHLEAALDQVRALVFLHQHRRAAPKIHRLTLLHPDDPTVWSVCAIAEAAAGRWGPARIAAERACALDPADPDLRESLGQIRRGEGILRVALVGFVEDMGDAWTDHVAHGDLLSQLGDMEGARAAYALARAAHPDGPLDAHSFMSPHEADSALRALETAALSRPQPRPSDDDDDTPF